MEYFVYKHINLLMWINCFCETYISYFPAIYDFIYGVIF